MTYVRPSFTTAEYLDEHGAPIRYGERWGSGSPAEETYSVTAHPERFEPLLAVAKALRAHLIETYDVTVDGDRLIPADPAAAPLEFTLADVGFPMVTARAGIMTEMRVPQCGCDACDEGLEELADLLEEWTFAVAEGRLEENLHGKNVRIAWSGPQTGIMWESRRKDHPKEVVKALRRHKPWQPWPLRSDSGTARTQGNTAG